MALEKSWMEIDNSAKLEYLQGVESFLEYAFEHAKEGNMIRCPCTKCRNVYYLQRHEVHLHLLKNGIIKSYTTWYCHGETWDGPTNMGTPSGSYNQQVAELHGDMKEQKKEIMKLKAQRNINYEPCVEKLYEVVQLGTANQNGSGMASERPHTHVTHIPTSKGRIKHQNVPFTLNTLETSEPQKDNDNSESSHSTETVEACIQPPTEPQRQDPATTEVSVPASRKRIRSSGRSMYKGIDLEKLTNSKKNKLIITMPPGTQIRPVEANERTLASWLGYCIQSTTGAPTRPWNVVHRQYSSRLWNMIMDYFEVSSESPSKWKKMEEEGKIEAENIEIKKQKFNTFCFAEMKNIYRKWRYKLHMHYKKYPTDEIRMQHVPPGLSVDSWKTMLKIFASEKFKAASDRNSSNRAYQKINSFDDPTPFSQMEYNMIDKETCEMTHVSDVWKAQCMYLKDDGTEKPMVAEAQQICDETRNIEDQPMTDIEMPPSSKDLSMRIFRTRKGYVPCKLFPYKSNNKEDSGKSNKVEDSISTLKEHVVELQNKIEKQHILIMELTAQVGALVQAYQISQQPAVTTQNGGMTSSST